MPAALERPRLVIAGAFALLGLLPLAVTLKPRRRASSPVWSASSRRLPQPELALGAEPD